MRLNSARRRSSRTRVAEPATACKGDCHCGQGSRSLSPSLMARETITAGKVDGCHTTQMEQTRSTLPARVTQMEQTSALDHEVFTPICLLRRHFYGVSADSERFLERPRARPESRPEAAAEIRVEIKAGRVAAGLGDPAPAPGAASAGLPWDSDEPVCRLRAAGAALGRRGAESESIRIRSSGTRIAAARATEPADGSRRRERGGGTRRRRTGTDQCIICWSQPAAGKRRRVQAGRGAGQRTTVDGRGKRQGPPKVNQRSCARLKKRGQRQGPLANGAGAPRARDGGFFS